MSLRRYLQRIQHIHSLIARRGTGTQKELAKRIGLSVSSLNEYLSEMKELGFPIRYDARCKTYYYETEGRMVSSLFERYE